MVSHLGARVILEVPKSLLDLLTDLEGVTELVAKGDELPTFDYHCPLLSLPLAFKTDIDSIPASNAYLAANPGKVLEWRARLGDSSKPRIGLVWNGNPEHPDDSARSILLSEFVKLMSSEFQYVCLQNEIREADKEPLSLHSEVLCYAEEIRDFADTAALCELVDVVIGVDTSLVQVRLVSRCGYCCRLIQIGVGCWIGAIVLGIPVPGSTNRLQWGVERRN